MRSPSRRTATLAAALLCMLGAGSVGAQEGKSDDPAFRIGIVAPEGTPVLEGLSAIKTAYARALGQPVEVFVARDYATLVTAHVEGRVDYAIYSATAFAAAAIRCSCVRPIVAPMRKNGAVGLRSVLIRRNGGDGHLAIGPRDSLAGRLAPLALYPEAADRTFRETAIETDSLADAEARFRAGEVDGFFGWVLAWPEETGAPAGGSVARLRQAGLDADRFTIAWQSETIRFGPHAVRADLDEDKVHRLRDLLTASRDTDLATSLDRLHGGGFVTVDEADYTVVVSIVEAGRR